MKNQVVLFQVVSVFEHHFVGVAFEIFVGSAGEVEGHFFWVEHFALIDAKGFEGKLGANGEQKPIIANLIQFILDSG